LIIVGASTRGAAQSAIRAGFTPWLADMFADADLAACGSVRRIENYPGELIDIFRDTPDAPWMYTGGLENYPALVEQLSSMRPLWGNSAEALRGVRDPLRLEDALSSAGFDIPQVRDSLDEASDKSNWMRKFKRSAGGRNIARIHNDTPSSRESIGGLYYQQRIDGQPISAVYVADGATTNLLGITTQLIGGDGSESFWCTADWTGANGYWYAGSIGPITEPVWLVDCAAALGTFVANRFKLRGLFGIDAILASDKLWPLEVNPRYTASIEVLERATGVRAIELHAQACARSLKLGDAQLGSRGECKLQFGKAVLYATQDIAVSREFSSFAAKQNENSAWPWIADIPHTGSMIPRETPICTVFSQGSEVSEVITGLQQRINQVLAALAQRSTKAAP
jgi:predicted ATP-grasp superfamily ATP-dependent carboligase